MSIDFLEVHLYAVSVSCMSSTRKAEPVKRTERGIRAGDKIRARLILVDCKEG